MELSKSFRYKSQVFDTGVLAQAVAKAVNILGLDASSATVTVAEDLPDGSHARRKARVAELETICDVAGVTVTFVEGRTADDVFFGFFGNSDSTITLSIQSPTADHIEAVRRTFESELGLEEAPAGDEETDPRCREEQSLEALAGRLSALEGIVHAPSRRLRCFLSYRFTDANELPALRIKQFLTLLDVEVLSGASYEPRQVSEKVLSKLRQPLDFIVLLLTGDGESMWTRDEIGAALHQGIALVPLVEGGMSLEPGLLADVEYVEFQNGHVGDAFLKLLEAVCFIRQHKLAAIADTVK